MRSIPPQLVRVGQVPTPNGAVVSGMVRDPSAVAEAIQDLWARGEFGSKEVFLGVGNQRVVVRDVVVPWQENGSLRETLPSRVRDVVPIPVEEAVIDHSILQDFQIDGARMLRLVVVAAQRRMLDPLVQAVLGAKLRPLAIDLVPFALVRSVGSLDGMGLGENDGQEAVVDVGAEVTSVCVHSNGVPRFVRILPSAGRDVTMALARKLGIEPEEAEALKREQETESPVAGRARGVVASVTGLLADEIRSTLELYESREAGAHVSRVILTGGGSKLDRLLAQLADQLPSEVVLGHPFDRVAPALDLPAETTAEAEALLAVAIGLALPGAGG